MKFNQINNNSGDVNNNVIENRAETRTETNSPIHNGDVNTATSQSGNVAQGVGTENKVKVMPPKEEEGVWGQLWKKVKGWIGMGGGH